MPIKMYFKFNDTVPPASARIKRISFMYGTNCRLLSRNPPEGEKRTSLDTD